MIRKMCSLFLALIFCFPAALSAGAEREFPPALQFSQEMTMKNTRDNRRYQITLPHTSRPEIDEELAVLINAMAEEASPLVKPGRNAANINLGDFGTYISRVGDRWMSFLTIGLVTDGNRQIWMQADARAYNMETGERLQLADLLNEETGAWEQLALEVREQLSALYPLEEADPQALDALCSREALAKTGFTIYPGHLSLIWPAEVLYPEHAPGLLRAEIYVPELYDLLTAQAREEMNCDGYVLVAVTYDDGPALGRTGKILNALRLNGAQATFFTIGANLKSRYDLLRREYDAGFSVQSHTWSHTTDTKTIKAGTIPAEKEKFDAMMSGLIGVKPKMMRAPGGIEYPYQKAGVQLPLISWNVFTLDIDKENENSDREVVKRAKKVQDGDILLFHDTWLWSYSAAEHYLEDYRKRSILAVTIDDLCALRGVPLEPGTVIRSCPPTARLP